MSFTSSPIRVKLERYEEEPQCIFHSRKWEWKIGWRILALHVAYSQSTLCRIINDGVEMVEKKRKRVVCSDVETLEKVA